jgi:hypothetical protein
MRQGLDADGDSDPDTDGDRDIHAAREDTRPTPWHPGDSEVWMERRAALVLSDGGSEQAATNWLNWRGCCAILLEQLPC